MKVTILVALMVALSIGYRYFVKSTKPTGKAVFSWGFILVLLSILENTQFESTAQMMGYIIILIIILNDGYDFVSSLQE